MYTAMHQRNAVMYQSQGIHPGLWNPVRVAQQMPALVLLRQLLTAAMNFEALMIAVGAMAGYSAAWSP